MIRRKEWWENNIGFTIGWNMTLDIQLSAKMVKDDVRIANRWKTYEKGARMPKLGFFPGTMHVQERYCVRKVLHAYAGWNLCEHKLKNRYTSVRTSLYTHEYRLHAQEHVYAHRNEHRRVFFNILKLCPFKTQPKHVPTHPKVSGLHLNPSHSKT